MCNSLSDYFSFKTIKTLGYLIQILEFPCTVLNQTFLLKLTIISHTAMRPYSELDIPKKNKLSRDIKKKKVQHITNEIYQSH